MFFLKFIPRSLETIFEYLKANDYIECRVQKGFIPKISGTIEHTQQLAYIIRHAKRKQKTLVVTLLDLKNAFGEVSHSLIPTVLQFHHIPREMQNIISELYSGFSTSIATKTFVTSPLQVERGVLQGDCLSPLLFNMLFNTFIQTLTKSKEFDQLNYRYDNIIQPRNWFQFADDAAAVTSSEYENQILLNVFTRWCNWSGMTIRVDKCKTFGIKKTVTRSVQFKPKLFLVREQVPTVDMDKSFKYLGRWYNFEMDNAEHKANIIQLTNDILMKIDSLPLQREESVWDRFMKLKKENCVIKALEHEVSKYRIKDWQLVSSSLPKNIFAFCRRGLILALPTNVNMCLWKMANSNLCQLCHQTQTQLHTVSMCNVALKDGRFTWRHNSVLYTLYHYISALSSQTNTNVFVDLLGHDSPASFFNSYRPDLLIVSGGKITAIELSICFETNFSKQDHTNKINIKT